MNWRMRTAAGLMLAAMLAACGQSQPPAETEVAPSPDPVPESSPAPDPAESAPVAPAPDVAGPADAPGSMVVYACDDGSGVTVTYDEYSALVKLPTGSTALSRAESSPSGGEAYLGEELSLYRNGNLVQLHVAGKSRGCTQTPTG